jgi:hypothetical protein
VSAGPEPQVEPQVIEQERRRLSKRLEEVARLCEGNVSPAVFYGELLKRLLEALAAPAGAVWTRTAQGNLQLQFQINMKDVGLDRSEEVRAAHEELLRRTVVEPRAFHLLPHSGVGPAAEGRAAGNATDLLLLMVPIQVGEQVAGLIEVWQAPNRPLAAVPGFLQYMALMADLAVRYQRNQIVGQLTGQQQLWVQLEGFARQIHGSLNPTEVAYLVANDGRRLIDCDRVSIAVRTGRRAKVVAVSGADVVETRSALVQKMRTLCDKVLRWGEKLQFNGTRDDGLPPQVLKALDAYLETSASKLLVVMPLRDEREGKEPTGPARSAMVMECFEPPAEPQQIMARLDVVAKHATPALYNAVEHRRIPMRWVWLPLAKVQEGIGGKARAISAAVVIALSLLVSAFVFVPYPLKMDAKGYLLPVVRKTIYSPVPGIVRKFDVVPTEVVAPDHSLAHLFDFETHSKLLTLTREMENAGREAEEADKQAKRDGIPHEERVRYLVKAYAKRKEQDSKAQEIEQYRKRANARRDKDHLGEFDLKAPPFTPEEQILIPLLKWTVLNGNFREEYTNRSVQASDPLLQLGVREGPWEIELRIPQKHIGQVLAAYDREDTDVLDVDFLLRSDPTRTWRGRLEKKRIARLTTDNKDDNNEPEPYVLAYVRVAGKECWKLTDRSIDALGGDDVPAAVTSKLNGWKGKDKQFTTRERFVTELAQVLDEGELARYQDRVVRRASAFDIDADSQLPRESLVSRTEIHAKVRCGKHRLGYSLFYGLWEFVYEKIVFWF